MHDQDGRLPEQDIRGLGLAMRDLCEQTGALRLELTKDSGRAVYIPGDGLQLHVDGTVLRIAEQQLDDVALVPAEPAMVGAELLDLIPRPDMDELRGAA